MNTKEKGKFNEALKLFDNKEYKNAKKACDKILEKQPTHSDAMALKGLVMAHMNEKVEGNKVINEAIRINLKNANAWHFFALFHKEDKNYAQAMRCYMQAQKYDSENFNVVRDLSYLQLYLRQFNSFLSSARRGMEMKANMMVNWCTYAFANYLTGNYDFAYRLLDSYQSIGASNVKDNEIHEVLLFQSTMLIKQEKYEEALNFLIKNEKKMRFDRTLLYEKIVSMCLILHKNEMAIEYINKLFTINSEKADYFIYYLNAKHNMDIKSFEECLRYTSESASELLKTVQEDLRPRIRSRILNRLELALSSGDKFKEIFYLYFLQNVKQNLPSFFINVKFLYLYQEAKIPIMESVLNSHLESIRTKGQLDLSLTNGEVLDVSPNLIWVYFYAAQHFDFLRESELALTYIDRAIDSTPSVVEFYTVKSKILQHSGMHALSAKAYEKAKKLDLGDRFLNAKYAKIHTRLGDVKKSVEIMKEFVKDPLSDENVEHFQCMWYEIESGYAYLNSNNILRAHRLFKAIFLHFNTLIEDQFDFYNYCLRRFMINDFANTIEYMDKILDKDNVYKAIFAFEVILEFLRRNNNKDTEKLLAAEFEEMSKEKLEKYKFKDIKSLMNEMDNDVYNLCLKLQPYSKIPKLHHLAVKSFLGRGKVLLALKSLLFLEQYATKSFFHQDALNRFNLYLKDNNDKIKGSHIESLVENKLTIKSAEGWTCENQMENILTNAYDSIFNKNESALNILEQVKDMDRPTLRKLKSQNSINEKIKIDVEPSLIEKNLEFYENLFK